VLRPAPYLLRPVVEADLAMLERWLGMPTLSHRGGRPRSSPRLCARQFDAGATVIGVDFHPDNVSAIRAYQKAGFAIVSGPRGMR
jgi:hypothetical protein